MDKKEVKKKKNPIRIGILVSTLALIGLTAWMVQSINSEVISAAKIQAAQEKIRQANEILIKKADTLEKGYFYQEALDLLNSGSENIDKEVTNDAIGMKIAEIKKAKESLVKYEGPIEHIFFHSLIIYPKLAFDDLDGSANGYNMWMTTVDEFKQMLPLIEERGYVLYPLDQIIENNPENPGEIRLKDIYLPPGKKPLVLSIDDVIYYEYMKNDGFANKLVIGDDGRVWTEVVTPTGQVVQTRDGDVMPILDDYVEANPEFSWRGAKGTMALTGYEGVFGYRITDNLCNTEEMQQTVKKISAIMKKNGWLFANHSYTHNSYFASRSIVGSQMAWELEEWKNKIEPWVGKTNLYISPFGYSLSKDDPRYRQIVSQGFQIFCPVGNERRIYINDDNIIMPRVNIDGFSMVTRKEELSNYYFNVDQVYDKGRPALIQ